MTNISQAEGSVGRVSDVTRWTQLIIGIVCMVMIANLQYGWTLFTIPISQKYGWGLASIQVAFTLSCCLKLGWCPSRVISSIASGRE